MKGIRKVIAERLQHSAQTAPHIALTLSVDMTEIKRLMANLAGPVRQETGLELTLTAILARVTALALIRHPRLNAHLVDQEIREFKEVALGIAVALEDGLIVPVIRNAQARGLAALQAELSDLAQRGRAGKLGLDQIKGSTFTISNLGMYGVEQFTAILNPPEVGILAVGAITPGPAELEGQLVMRPLMRLTLMVDHRAVDGAVGAQFLATVKTILENPYRLSL
jgi:pyruvate dehydrogenase E2 component (dihydrolipoamide acetyltransferase)